MTRLKVACEAAKSSLGLLTLLCLTLWASLAAAHETRPAIADVLVTSDRLEMRIELTAESLIAGIDQSRFTDTNDAPQAAEYDRLRALAPEALTQIFEDAWPRLAPGFLTEGAGALSLDAVEIADPGDVELPRDTIVTLSAPLPEGDAPVRVGWVAEYGPIVVRLGSGENAYAAFLESGEMSAELPRDARVNESGGAVFLRYLIDGFEHIVPKGIDHILFVLGLFLFSLNWRPLLWQVTAFTLAHSVTLVLASLEIVSIPENAMWAVEALIAISITYVAVENILRPKLGWWRTAVVFAFGLLHGLGFASVLGDLGLSQGQFALSLIAFNVGVEIGQLAVIAVAFVLLAVPLGRTAYYRTAVVIPGSLAIAAVGLYWFIERAFL